MLESAMGNTKTANYHVKNSEPVMIGTDVRARLFTLAPEDVIPWHSHPETADHYFILEGELTVSTRRPEETQTGGMGCNYRIAPGRPHLIANRSAAKCLGTFRWIKIDD